MYTINF